MITLKLEITEIILNQGSKLKFLSHVLDFYLLCVLCWFYMHMMCIDVMLLILPEW